MYNKSILSFKGLFLLSAFFLFSSCGKNNCDTTCDLAFPEIIFKIENIGGQNLTCGPAKIFSSEKIKIKYLEAGVLKDLEKTFSGDSALASSGILFLPTNTFNQYYLYLNNIKTDSIQLTYQKFEGKSDCCPSYYTATSIKLNNNTVAVPFKVVK